MKTQSYKRLMQYCDFVSVLSLFASIAYGFSQILPLCYEMGKDNNDTFIWEALVQAIECYAIFFIGLLTYFMARNVKKKSILSRQPTDFVSHRNLHNAFGSTDECHRQSHPNRHIPSEQHPADCDRSRFRAGILVV